VCLRIACHLIHETALPKRFEKGTNLRSKRVYREIISDHERSELKHLRSCGKNQESAGRGSGERIACKHRKRFLIGCTYGGDPPGIL
jgi:hypothetical protein